jgi:hypothetical protein
MAKYLVSLPITNPLPRRRGGIIYYPGAAVECDEVPEAIAGDLAVDPASWNVREVLPDPKPRSKRPVPEPEPTPES